MITVKTIEHKRILFGKELSPSVEHQLINDDGEPFWLAGSRETADKMARELNDLAASGKYNAVDESAILNQQIGKREIVYVAVNLRNADGFAPVIYRQYEDGMDESGSKPWSEVHKSWQRRDGSSESGNLQQDAVECLAALEHLKSEGYTTYAY